FQAEDGIRDFHVTGVQTCALPILDDPAGAPFNYQKVVPTFIVHALKGLPLPVFGNGRQTAEYVYVTDVARAFWLAGRAPAQRVRSEERRAGQERRTE